MTLRYFLKPLFVFCFLFLSINLVESEEFDHTHSVWNLVLQKYVVVNGSQTSVKYSELLNAQSNLDAYLQSLEQISKQSFDGFTQEQQITFLINAYNAFTVKWILKNYPTSSIKKTTGLLSSPWKQKFFSLFGKKRHLDYIEHDVLRKDYKEPRIHFALVCAARSCPPLRNEAYTAKGLEEQLTAAAANFLNDSTRNYYDSKKQRLFLSKIFDWFGDDFRAVEKSVQQYVVKRMDSAPKTLQSAEISLSFLDYDWSLNEAK